MSLYDSLVQLQECTQFHDWEHICKLKNDGCKAFVICSFLKRFVSCMMLAWRMMFQPNKIQIHILMDKYDCKDMLLLLNLTLHNDLFLFGNVLPIFNLSSVLILFQLVFGWTSGSQAMVFLRTMFSLLLPLVNRNSQLTSKNEVFKISFLHYKI